MGKVRVVIFFALLVGMDKLVYGNNSEMQRYNCDSNSDEPWCIPNDYDFKVDPVIYKHLSNISLPWNYSYDLWLMEIAEVNDKEQRISFSIYFTTEWYEPRLIIKESSKEWTDDMGNKRESLVIPFGTKLWLPDLEIFGLRTFETKEVYKDKKMGYFKVKRDKTLRIHYYSEISTTCKMNFTKFPFDQQTCNFLVTSYTNTDDKIKCNSKLVTGEFLGDYPQRSLQYDVSWKHRNMKLVMTFPHGAWEYCGFQVQLHRIKTKYVYGSYIPSCFFVILSWMSFIVKPDAIPGRMMLLLNIFLILIILMNDVKEAAPDSNHFNEIDLYLGVCTIHVFGAILEYAFLLFIMKKLDLEWKNGQKKDVSAHVNKVHVLSIEGLNALNKKDSKRSKPKQTANNISITLFFNLDWISLFIFPISFSIFNAFYWCRNN